MSIDCTTEFARGASARFPGYIAIDYKYVKKGELFGDYSHCKGWIVRKADYDIYSPKLIMIEKSNHTDPEPTVVSDTDSEDR